MSDQSKPKHSVFINQFALWRLVQDGKTIISARSIDQPEGKSIPILLSVKPLASDDSDKS